MQSPIAVYSAWNSESILSSFSVVLAHVLHELVWLSPPEPDFASKRSGAQECPAPNGALLSKRSEVASNCWRAAERPLYEKGETKEEDKKKHTNHTQVVALTIHVNTHQ